jgi:hypothetical protein
MWKAGIGLRWRREVEDDPAATAVAGNSSVCIVERSVWGRRGQRVSRAELCFGDSPFALFTRLSNTAVLVWA